MPWYCVTWEIELEADSHKEAAKLALAIQRDPASMATRFGVVDRQGRFCEIDVEEEEVDSDG